MQMLLMFMPRCVRSNHFWTGRLCGVALLFSVTALWGCTAPEGREIERLPSPDTAVDAVVIEPKSHATAPISTLIYLVAPGKDWKDDSPVVSGQYMEGLKLRWERPRFLAIHYKKGRIANFTSFWRSKDVDTFKHVIELRLVPESDSTLPE